MTENELFAEALLVEWLKTRPAAVQALAREFKPGVPHIINGVTHWAIGYTEEDEVIFTDVDTRVDYEGAMKRKKYIHAKCLREAKQ